ncbi:hypothetical protein CDAR_379471 [Caerostris darwini]|uniref:Uncharacterized protein n=1 Tax=Caerostris darwini TaxID=1538125 RepID=A0AAV4V9D9_9ARAC|nr:hypothetical protein CDAR_379471 [Caerostris darwini]
MTGKEEKKTCLLPVRGMIPKPKERDAPRQKVDGKGRSSSHCLLSIFWLSLAKRRFTRCFMGKVGNIAGNKEKNHCWPCRGRTDFYCRRSRFGLEKHTRSTTRLVSFRQEQMCPEIVIAA